MSNNNVLSTMQLVCLVATIFSGATFAERIMRPKVKDIKIWSDNVYATHSVVFDGADPHVNFSMTALQELHDVDIHVEGNVVQKADPSYFLTFNTTMNLCRIINWRNNSPLGTLIHSYLKEYGNLIETCPIAKGTYRFHKRFGHTFQGEYFIHKFWIPEDASTALLPEVDFEIRFAAFHVDGSKKRTLIADDHITGEGVVQDVNNIKRGIFAMLPKSG